jgi:hypothetical protein
MPQIGKTRKQDADMRDLAQRGTELTSETVSHELCIDYV